MPRQSSNHARPATISPMAPRAARPKGMGTQHPPPCSFRGGHVHACPVAHHHPAGDDPRRGPRDHAHPPCRQPYRWPHPRRHHPPVSRPYHTISDVGLIGGGQWKDRSSPPVCASPPYTLSSHTRCISIELAGIGWKFFTYLVKIFCSFSCRITAAGASSTMIFTAAS
jgi:hypothetical protein